MCARQAHVCPFPAAIVASLRALLNASNRAGPAGAEGIAAALEKSPALQELHFSGHALGDAGVSNLIAGAVRGRGLKGDGPVSLGQSAMARCLWPNTLTLWKY